MTTKATPNGDLFGYEIADPIARAKAIQKQMISALATNSVAVTLPVLTPAGGNSVQDQINQTNTAIMTAMTGAGVSYLIPSLTPVAVAGVAGVGYISSATPTHLISLTAKNAGNDSNTIRFKVEAGTTEHTFKVTINKGQHTDVYDNLADVDATVTAINANASALVVAVKLTAGTIVNSAYAYLSGGVDGKEADVRINDGSIDRALATLDALANALRTAGMLA